MEGVASPQNDEQRNAGVEADDNPLPARLGKRGRRQRSKVWGHFTIVEGCCNSRTFREGGEPCPRKLRAEGKFVGFGRVVW